MVESGSLENCCTLTGTVGSNPTLSAIIIRELRSDIYDLKSETSDLKFMIRALAPGLKFLI